MRKKIKKPRPVVGPDGEFKSFASVYAATLAKRVAAELSPLSARPAPRKRKPPA